MEAVTAEAMKACEALGTRLEKSCKAALRAETSAREAHSSCFDSRLAGLASVVDTLSANMQKALHSEQKLLQRVDEMMQESVQGKLLQYLDGLREAELLERRELHETFNRRLDELAWQVRNSFETEARTRSTLECARECACHHELPVPTQEKWCSFSTCATEELSRSSQDIPSVDFAKALETQRVVHRPHTGSSVQRQGSDKDIRYSPRRSVRGTQDQQRQQQPQQQQQQHPAAASCSTSLHRLGSRADVDALRAPQIRSPRAEHKQPAASSISSGISRSHDYSPRPSVPLSARWRNTSNMAVATS